MKTGKAGFAPHSNHRMSVKRHTAYNLGGAVAPAAIMLVSVPIYIELLGEARYGILAIIWLFTGSLAFFDFGLGRATAYAISSKTSAGGAERERIFWTAVIVNLVFGTLGGLVVVLASPLLFAGVFNVPPALQEELKPVLPLLGLAIPLLTLEGVLTGALTGRERFLSLNIRTIIGTTITQLLPLISVWLLGPTLTVAVIATIAARALSVAIFVMIAFRIVPAGWRPRWGGKRLVRELLNYGGWISLSAMLNPLIAALDRFLIAVFLNPFAVALYVVPFDLVTRAAMFSRALGTAIFPKLAKLDQEQATELSWRAIKANAGLMTILCIPGILIIEPFISLWINPSFAKDAALVGELIAITLWLNALAIVPHAMLQAQGRPKATTLILLLQFFPYAALLLPSVIWFGIVGVAAARNFRSVLDLTLLAHQAGLLGRVVPFTIIPLCLLGSAIFVSRTWGIASLAGAGTATLTLTLAIVWSAWASVDLRATAQSALIRFVALARQSRVGTRQK